MSFQTLSTRTLALALALVVVIGAAVIFPGQSESALGQTGHWEWVISDVINPNPGKVIKNCPAGTVCNNWCFVGPDGMFPTPTTCCVNGAGQCLDDDL